MSAQALLLQTPHPTEDQVEAGAGGQPLPLRRVHADPARGDARGEGHDARVRLDQAVTPQSRRRPRASASPLDAAAQRRHQQPARRDSARARPLDPKEVDSFLAIHPDGSLTIYTSKVDVGTGMRIAIAQMAAEELGVAARAHHARRRRHGAMSRTPAAPAAAPALTRGGTARAAGRGDRATGAAPPRRRALEAPGRRARRSSPARCGASAAVAAASASAACVGGRRLPCRSTPKAPLAAAVRLHDRRHIAAEARRARQVHRPLHLHPGLHRPRHAARAASSVRRRSARRLVSVDEASVSRIFPAFASSASRASSPWSRADEWAAVRAARELKATWTECAGPAGPRRPRALSARGRRRARSDIRRPRQRRAIAAGRRRDADADGDLLLAVSEPRVAGAVVRRRRRARRRRHSLDVVAGDLRPARDPGAGLRPAGGEDARDLRRGVGIVRHQRRRPCGGRRGAACRRRSAARCACSGRGRTSTDGIRKDRSSCSICAPASTPAAGWSAGRPRCGSRPTAAARASCSPREAAGIPQDSGRDAAAIYENGDPSYAVDHVRVVAHWMRDTPLNPVEPARAGQARRTCSRSRASPTRSRQRRQSIRWRSGGAPDRSARARSAHARRRGVRLAAEAVARIPQRQQGGLLVGRGMAYVRYKQAENYVAMFMEVAVDPATRRHHGHGASCARTTAGWSSTRTR